MLQLLTGEHTQTVLIKSNIGDITWLKQIQIQIQIISSWSENDEDQKQEVVLFWYDYVPGSHLQEHNSPERIYFFRFFNMIF